MHLTDKEIERALIFSIAELARKRKSKKIKLNYPESVALLCDEIMEMARNGKTLSEVLGEVPNILHKDDVMEGVPDLLDALQVEAIFTDGTKLVVVRNPITL